MQPRFVFLLTGALHAPGQLDDRAFGAQRFSECRAERRFAPPSAVDDASRCHDFLEAWPENAPGATA